MRARSDGGACVVCQLAIEVKKSWTWSRLPSTPDLRERALRHRMRRRTPSGAPAMSPAVCGDRCHATLPIAAASVLVLRRLRSVRERHCRPGSYDTGQRACRSSPTTTRHPGGTRLGIKGTPPGSSEITNRCAEMATLTFTRSKLTSRALKVYRPMPHRLFTAAGKVMACWRCALVGCLPRTADHARQGAPSFPGVPSPSEVNSFATRRLWSRSCTEL